MATHARKVAHMLGSLLLAVSLTACNLLVPNVPPPEAPEAVVEVRDEGDAAAEVAAEDESPAQDATAAEPAPNDEAPPVTEGASYTSKDEVAAYLHLFGHLPPNFISKTKARAAGWDSSAGNLDDVLPGMSIGGSVFYNDEGLLPEANGRTYHECDVNYHGGYRGPERLVWSSDGLIFYTADHYQTFEQLY